VYGGGYPITECTDPELIRRIIANDEHIWVLTFDGDTVVAATVSRPEPGLGVYELCRAAVLPDYTGRAGFAEIFTRSVVATIQRPDCALIYGYGRSEHARRAFSRVPYPMAWVGTDGGMHTVGATREEHLIGVAFNPARETTRILPRLSVLSPDSAVADEVAKLPARTRVDTYPAVIAAGAEGAHVYESAHSRVTYSIIGTSRAMVVGTLAAETPADAGRVLREAVAAAPEPIDHVTVYVLADKVAVLADLCHPDNLESTRFAARAYLPGWYGLDGERYDCVTVTARLDAGEPLARLGFADRVEAIYQSFPAAMR
jgi:hypothetical protein